MYMVTFMFVGSLRIYFYVTAPDMGTGPSYSIYLQTSLVQLDGGVILLIILSEDLELFRVTNRYGQECVLP